MIYVVRSGDTLRSIACRFKTDIKTLVRLNHLGDQLRLTTGLALWVPCACPSSGYDMELVFFARPDVSHTVLSQLLPCATYLFVSSANAMPDGSLSKPNWKNITDVAIDNHALPILTVTNFDEKCQGYSSTIAHTLFTDAAVQDKFFENLCSAPFGGVCFNFQYIHPFEKELYSRFLRRAADILHPRGAYLFAAAAPKTENSDCSLISGAHDYAAMASCCDRVIILCSDCGIIPSAPRPLSPVTKLREVISYAVTQIPSGKILMELSCRACNWPFSPEEKEAELIPASLSANLAVSVGAEIKYDSGAEAPYFTYFDPCTGKHTVWFEDVRSFAAKLRLAENFCLAGVSAWCSNTSPGSPIQFLLSAASVEKIQ